MSADEVAQVVVALPLDRVFSYAIPGHLAGRLQPGQRVRVPFRGRPRVGVVVGLGGSSPSSLQAIEDVLDPVPALTGPLLELTRRAAEETASAWGEAVARALPPSARVAAPTALPAAGMGASSGAVIVGYGSARGRLIEAAAAGALESGRGALLLVPEIETARVWAERLERGLAIPVTRVTSAQSARQRWEAWWACRQGSARLAVGTRVAAFLPLQFPGVVIVIDEHDPAHKAPDAPRWHVRDLAIRRARREGADCLLASGTPSLESWVCARAGQATAEEAKGEGWPEVHRVDLRVSGVTAGLSRGLREAVSEALAAGQPSLVLLNRVGYGQTLACAECGAVRRCGRCRVTLTYHLRARALTCRLCGLRQAAASLCWRCRGRRLLPLGWGTERLEAEVLRAFPRAGVARYDGEVSRERAASVREAFRAGRVRVLVGTQMALRLLADTPVRVAALVADATLSLPDFRAGERTFQLAWQLAEGVAPGGSLWLQSSFPDHPALAAVAFGQRELFYEREWKERQELGYPPARRMARILAEGRDATRLIVEVADRCRSSGLSVLGPVVLSGARVQLVLQGDHDVPMALSRALAPFRGHRRWGSIQLLVDVDPVDLL
ncbi:MAG: replication restart helicase PriA [Candidatus Rokuibacteriota bacterium]